MYIRKSIIYTSNLYASRMSVQDIEELLLFQDDVLKIEKEGKRMIK